MIGTIEQILMRVKMKVTLEFDNDQSADNFIDWWLDGGGEQEANFNSTSWNNYQRYIRVEGNGWTIPEEEDKE